MKTDDIKKEVRREEDEFYGEETESGSSPRPSSDDDVEKDLFKVDPRAKEKVKSHIPFDIQEDFDEKDPKE